MDAIEKLLEDDFEAGNAGDVEALLRLRTEDSVSIFLGEPELVGKDAIRAAWNQDTDFVAEYTDRSVEEIRIAGDWAFVRFTFAYTERPVDGGESSSRNCRVMWVIHQQRDATWKIHWEMVNSSDSQT